MTQDKIQKRCLAEKLTAEEERERQKLSPFELKNDLLKFAGDSGKPVLNAGRGNPNFLNTLARRGFAKLMEFAVDSCTDLHSNVGLRPEKGKASHQELRQWLQGDKSQAARFLLQAVDYSVNELGLAADAFVFELVDGILGDFYPSPPRILKKVEQVVGAYLDQVLLGGKPRRGHFDYFATEGGTAGMVYAFKSLEENFLLNKRDKVAIITPIFSPYLEIPQLNDFEFEVVPIEASEDDHWQIPQKEIRKLEDQSIKVLYTVNPTNPTAVALSKETLDGLERAVKKNPGLIILVDAVYATFVDRFHSLIDRLPRNCLVVYSFSKYFGATGWRLGAMMLHKKNVIDKRIGDFPPEWKRALADRYRIASEDVDEIKFIDRLVHDSRDVALSHTAGLSCSQQVMMALFALHDLLHQKTYKPAVRGLIDTRIEALYKPFGDRIAYSRSKEDTHYYTLIDVLELAASYEEGLDKHMNDWFYPVDFVYCLADEGAVCLPGYGFFEPENESANQLTAADRNRWSTRVSLANLDEPQYAELGKRIVAVIEKYKRDFDQSR